MTVPKKRIYARTTMSRLYPRMLPGTHRRDPREPPTIRQMIERLTRYVRPLSLFRSARIGSSFPKSFAVLHERFENRGPRFPSSAR
jgi:hypothetical protein